MSPQPQVRQHPGYGSIYPDGVNGIKVVKTYTEGPKRSYNPDGSTSYSNPPPTVHELFGGGFTYADGSPVTDRKHLENITDQKMRERALAWFDGSREISEEAMSDVPKLDIEHREKPETVFITSNDPDFDKAREKDRLVKHIDEMSKPSPADPTSQILEAIAGLTEVVKEQGKKIQVLEEIAVKSVTPSKRSLTAKQRWADPKFRAEQLAKVKAKVLARKAKREAKLNGTTQAGETV